MDSSVREKQIFSTCVQWHVSWFGHWVGFFPCSNPQIWMAICVLLLWLPWKYLVCIMDKKSRFLFPLFFCIETLIIILRKLYLVKQESGDFNAINFQSTFSLFQFVQYLGVGLSFANEYQILLTHLRLLKLTN